MASAAKFAPAAFNPFNATLLGTGLGVEMAEGEDHGVGDERFGAPFQPHPLVVARSGDPYGAVRVLLDGDPGGQGGHRPPYTQHR